MMDIYEDDNGAIKFLPNESNKITNLFKKNIETKRKPSLGLGFSKYYDINDNNLDFIKTDIDYYLMRNGIITYASRVNIIDYDNMIAKVVIFSIIDQSSVFEFFLNDIVGA